MILLILFASFSSLFRKPLSGVPMVTHSDVQGDWPGEGNIDADPLFVDPDNGDYHLRDDSPCISAGIMTPDVPDTDIEGNPRPNPPGSNPDIGAYEHFSSADIITLTLDGVSVSDCGETWMEAGVELSFVATTEEDCGPDSCYFGLEPARVWLFPARLNLNLSGLAGTVTQVEVDIIDLCGVGCTRAFLYDSASTVDSVENSVLGPETLTLSSDGAPVDRAAVSSCEGTVIEIRIILEDVPLAVPGDVSGNGQVTAYDASLVLRYVVGLTNLSEEQRQAADVTGDGTVTALDAALILQYTVGLITQFPIQQGAPTLTAKDENQILTKIIAELENVPLTTEQKNVLEQLKHLIGQQSLPGHTALLQNYPNPFNPETWLPYQLAQDASVTICIYNIKGQLIRTLHLGNQKAGVYMTKDKAAHWDGKDSLGQSVASGVYFYTLQVEVASLRSNLRQRNPDRNGAGTFTATRKMFIVK